MWERGPGPTAQLRATPLEPCSAKLGKTQNSANLQTVLRRNEGRHDFCDRCREGFTDSEEVQSLLF